MQIIGEKNGITYTSGRRGLVVGLTFKPEPSQGASNCVTACLEESGAVVMGDTQNRQAGLQLPGTAWASMLQAVA